MADYTVPLRRYYAYYTAGFFIFIGTLAVLERHGMPPRWIGYSFLFLTIFLYATIGVLARTASVSEYYVAGRRVPAVFNGMATGADWMSSASFMGLAGTLYLSGYQGLAYVMGWTGGYVLVALLLAPYLRRFGQYTIPDFLAARYGGNLARLVGVFATVLASFVYVVAQIYGVGLITSRFVGLQFEVGVFVGLAGILVCSFLGGMRAVTWTQVAQYAILIVAYLVPVTILSYQVTGIPVPQLTYGQVLQTVQLLEERIFDDPSELDARRLFRERADGYYDRILTLPDSLEEERRSLSGRIDDLKSSNAQMRDVVSLERQRRDLPKSSEEARSHWDGLMRQAAQRGAAPDHHLTPYPGKGEAVNDDARLNFLSLVFCLMVGTAALPHVLMRYYTTPSVREARNSVFWSLLFILALYLTAPAYAAFAKYEVYTSLVGSSMAQLPVWVNSWGKIGMVSIEDINGDGILQLAELSLNPDVILLATPEIAGLPYVISGLVAAGALAAALSTADGLLLTIASALAHDVYYKIFRPNASTQWRLVVSKSLLLVVAVLAASVASQKPATILFMVAWAFSLAGSAFFPALILGIFWKRATPRGAVSGMLIGLLVTIYYMVRVHFDAIPWLGIHGFGMEPWLGIQSTAAGVWGVAAGFLTIIVVSLFDRPPSQETQNFVESVRYPEFDHW
ncbi:MULTISPECIES: sodium:solute symporter family protein [Candidatus Accumulibacter]|jgi:cation/acetate symporter|uniref:Cation acetate symporter n=2 Tax=Candidatus Accumulibacter TaxID=327159 RepID=A0ABX1TD95_9PROT|nr:MULTISPECIES: sodium:solute symporter family protein [Candidatus Accumulibacter]MBL8408143.1 cation acetate symporter [Accumulibacter sp.]NMQ06222.1 cation acetate symporter [Candidatus Accumulibacter contiguus]HRF11343.1 cation acetate symporter [Candidatus Accumulibacter phosphatis]